MEAFLLKDRKEPITCSVDTDCSFPEEKLMLLPSGVKAQAIGILCSLSNSTHHNKALATLLQHIRA